MKKLDKNAYVEKRYDKNEIQKQNVEIQGDELGGF